MSSRPHNLKQQVSVRAILLLILGVGFILRLPGLDRDLWYDESLSLFHARGANPLTKIIPNGPEVTSDLFTTDRGWREALMAISQIEQTPPFYFLLLRVWTKLFGESNRALRLLSVILGLAAIPVIFLLGWKIFDQKVGLGAAGVLAILPLHLQYSQEIRAYALAFLLATLASWTFLCACQAMGQSRDGRWWLLYFGLMTLSLYTHYFTAGTFLAHGLFTLMQPHSLRFRLVKRVLTATAVALLLLIPWLLIQYVNQSHLWVFQPRTEALHFWTLDTLKRLVSMICYFVVGWLPGTTFRSVLGVSLLGLYGIAALTLYIVMCKREIQPALMFGSFLLFMPIFFVIGVEVILNDSGLLLFPRFALPASIGLCLLFGLAIVCSHRRTLSVLIAAMIVALTGYFQLQWHRVNASPSPLPGLPWFYGNLSSAVGKVSQEASPSELILFDDVHLMSTWNVYQKSRVPQLLMSRKDFVNRARDFDSRWREVESKYTSIHLIRRVGELPSEVVKRLEAHYRLISNERVGRLEIRHYVK